MMNLKNSQHGFTLVETLFSIVLVAVSIGPVVDLQSFAARSISQTVQDLDRTLTAYDFFILHVGSEKEQVQKSSTEPEMTLLFEHKPLPSTSVLVKEFQHLHIEQVSWQWQDDRGTQHGMLASLQFVPPKPEEAVEPKKDEASGQKSATEKPQQATTPSATEKSVQLSSIKNVSPIVAAPGGKK